MSRAGFELKAKGGERSEETPLVTYRGEVSSLTPNVTECVSRFTHGQAYLWSLFSGATHSRAWLIAGLEGDMTELFTTILSPLLDTSDTLVVEVGHYLGLDPRPTVHRTHRHARC